MLQDFILIKNLQMQQVSDDAATLTFYDNSNLNVRMRQILWTLNPGRREINPHKRKSSD